VGNSQKEGINKTSPEQAEKSPAGESHLVAEPLWWKAPVEFGCHIMVGTGIFALIALAAVGLDFLLKWLETIKISSFIICGLTLAKKSVFVLDVALYLIYLVNASWLFLRGMKWKK
jgi:hypothetical protein